MNVFWFRRDLRLQDNHALFQCLKEGKKTLAIFIFDSEIISHLPKNDTRISLIYNALQDIQTQLKDQKLQIYHGKPLDIFKQLTQQFSVEKVFTNEDYEPSAMQRDAEVNTFLHTQNIEFKRFTDHVMFHPSTILKPDNTPYTIYTPFSKKWKAHFQTQKAAHYPSEKYMDSIVTEQYSNLNLEAIGFQHSKSRIPVEINVQNIKTYSKTRDFPAKDTTSKLGTALRFGTISIRELVQKTAPPNETFLNELIWREFFIQIMYHFPKSMYQCFKLKYEAIEWLNKEEDFEKWKAGKTGYPIVDAGMRELNQTGFMHNRVRMITASFLCKHLLIDWRWGEAYFAEKLHDFEQASNVGNWQWASGTGCDAAPYFRVFNPSIQTQKFDGKLEYIQKWVPEFQELTYPEPMVEHTFARERAIAHYKKFLK